MLNRRAGNRYIILSSLAIVFVICSFIWLGFHEYNSVKEIHQIINTDFKEVELQFEKAFAKNDSAKFLHAKTQAHLAKRIQTSHYNFILISASLILLTAAWLFALLYLRRLNKFNGSKEQLEELLYYEQMSELHASPQSKDSLPSALKEMQLDRVKFTSELKRALKKKQFILYYQPIVDTNSGEVRDVEALIRWQHPSYGLLRPDTFLPACENNGLIIPIGEWVLRSACEQLKEWQAMGFQKLGMSVNLSTLQLNHPGLLNLVKDVLAESGIPPWSLKLEVTESALMKNVAASIKLLRSLKKLGIQISLDDFGTGYSSLNYLKQFPVSILKIDKTFISDITGSITSLALVESIITLGKNLGLMITAEGVETDEQLHLLKRLKCDLIQGFLYSRPLPAQDFKNIFLLSTNYFANKTTNALFDDSDKYVCETLETRHYEQAVEVITQAFCESEPMTKYLGITPREFIVFAEPLVKKAIEDGLSNVMLDQNKVVACTIVEDVANPLSIPSHLDPRFKIIFSLLEQLGSQFFSERVLEKGRIAHLFITAVDKKFNGEGLSKKINFESIKLARKKGYDFMCCEFTHHYNEKGLVKNLDTSRLLIRSCVYKDFEFEGTKPFKNLEGSASAYIWELREGAQLRYQVNENINLPLEMD